MTQSKAEITIDKQILYLVQWFAEFSDFQKSDFLQDHLLPLYRSFLKCKLLLLDNGELEISNGVANIDLDSERPPSIFQCRMKLFSDWYPTWSNKERIEFLARLRNLDADFIKEFCYYFFTENQIQTSEAFIDIIKASTDVSDSERDELITRLALNEVFANELEMIRKMKHSNVPAMPLIDDNKIIENDNTNDDVNKSNMTFINNNHDDDDDDDDDDNEKVIQQQPPLDSTSVLHDDHNDGDGDNDHQQQKLEIVDDKQDHYVHVEDEHISEQKIEQIEKEETYDALLKTSEAIDEEITTTTTTIVTSEVVA